MVMRVRTPECMQQFVREIGPVWLDLKYDPTPLPPRKKRSKPRRQTESTSSISVVQRTPVEAGVVISTSVGASKLCRK